MARVAELAIKELEAEARRLLEDATRRVPIDTATANSYVTHEEADGYLRFGCDRVGYLFDDELADIPMQRGRDGVFRPRRRRS